MRACIMRGVGDFKTIMLWRNFSATNRAPSGEVLGRPRANASPPERAGRLSSREQQCRIALAI